MENITPYLPWILLAGSAAAAVVIDLFLVRVGLELLKPTSVHVFQLTRGAKIAAFAAWLLYFHHYWYPQFAGGGLPAGQGMTAAEVGVVGAVVAVAWATMPRRRLVHRTNGEAHRGS